MRTASKKSPNKPHIQFSVVLCNKCIYVDIKLYLPCRRQKEVLEDCEMLYARPVLAITLGGDNFQLKMETYKVG